MDYETWSPPRPDTCLLGQNYTMRRRKREAQCFNSYDFNDVSVQKPHCDKLSRNMSPHRRKCHHACHHHA